MTNKYQYMSSMYDSHEQAGLGRHDAGIKAVKGVGGGVRAWESNWLLLIRLRKMRGWTIHTYAYNRLMGIQYFAGRVIKHLIMHYILHARHFLQELYRQLYLKCIVLFHKLSDVFFFHFLKLKKNVLKWHLCILIQLHITIEWAKSSSFVTHKGWEVLYECQF